MKYLVLMLAVVATICVANLVGPPVGDHGGGPLLESSTSSSHGTSRPRIPLHKLRRHFKRGHGYGMLCGRDRCPPDSMLVYYRCCRNSHDQCCWYLRIWVVAVFGALLLKAMLAFFVSFFRCVCC